MLSFSFLYGLLSHFFCSDHIGYSLFPLSLMFSLFLPLPTNLKPSSSSLCTSLIPLSASPVFFLPALIIPVLPSVSLSGCHFSLLLFVSYSHAFIFLQLSSSPSSPTASPSHRHSLRLLSEFLWHLVLQRKHGHITTKTRPPVHHVYGCWG